MGATTQNNTTATDYHYSSQGMVKDDLAEYQPRNRIKSIYEIEDEANKIVGRLRMVMTKY